MMTAGTSSASVNTQKVTGSPLTAVCGSVPVSSMSHQEDSPDPGGGGGEYPGGGGGEEPGGGGGEYPGCTCRPAEVDVGK